MADADLFAELPDSWQVKRLADIAELLQYGTSVRCEESPIGRPVLRIPNVVSGSIDAADLKYTELPKQEREKYELRDGDLLFVRTNGVRENIGRCAVYHGKPTGALFASYLIRAQLNSGLIDPDFVGYYSKTSIGREFLAGRASGAADGKFNINTQILRDVLVPTPPLKEQKAIVAVLRTVQRAKEAAEAVTSAARQLKRSLLRHLFTYGPVPVDHADRVPLKETDIGPIPEHWELKRLGDLLREPLRNGHSAKATNTDQGIRTLTLTAVTQNDFSIQNTKLTSAEPERVRGMWLQSGDILIERANTPEYVGLAALYEGPSDFAIYPDLMVRVRPRLEVTRPKFLAEFLLTASCRTYYRSNAKATAGNFPKIDQPIIKATQVPVPSLTEQDEIAAALRAADARIRVEESRVSALDALFRSLLGELMTGRVRVHELNIPIRAEVGA